MKIGAFIFLAWVTCSTVWGVEAGTVSGFSEDSSSEARGFEIEGNVDLQRLTSEVVRLEEGWHQALRQGDVGQLTELLSEAESLEAQLRTVREDSESGGRSERAAVLPPLDILTGLQGDVDRLMAHRSWRKRRPPRIELPPDPGLITVHTKEDGQMELMGKPGAAGDPRARVVRLVNLQTGDEAAARVHADGSFQVRLIAPPGSSLQISTAMQEDFPEDLRRRLNATWGLELTYLGEELKGMLQQDRSCSPGLILPVTSDAVNAQASACFVRKLGTQRWAFGTARLSQTEFQPGDHGEVRVALSHRCESEATARRLAADAFEVGCLLTPRFDQDGRQLSALRLLATHVLTPTGLPIETQTDLVGRRDPDGVTRVEPGPQGVETPIHGIDFGRWIIEGRMARVSLNIQFEIPPHVPSGSYALNGHFQPRLDREFFGLEHPGETFLGRVTVGDPKRPRLACMLLASSGSGGAQGAIAREDTSAYNVVPRNVLRPEKLIVPRDDVYTGEPLRYSLDPYLPLVSLSDRPHELRLWPPRIVFDHESGCLEVRVLAPDGTTERLGPAPLVAAQNDLTSVSPDRLVRDRIVAPVGTAYGNPSLADIYHLTGRGAFDFVFTQYGHYVISLQGTIDDLRGAPHTISGTYDVYVARPLDLDVFPEPGTPLWPGARVWPQARVFPPVPAELSMTFLHVPGSDPDQAFVQRFSGRANQWGVFVPDSEEDFLRFSDPGEYRCDVTAKYVDAAGVWWMASRRGASVVVTPNSEIVIHGERGSRTPSLRWRARWFLAPNSHFLANSPEGGFDMGHTCFPYESGDVAWLGDRDPDSLFPNLTFEDPEGKIASLVAERWPAVRSGAGRAGLYPDALRPEDRLAIGEMPFVSSSSVGLSPSLKPEAVDQWGYFYSTSWRPGISVRSHVAEDMVPASYWFFDDVYGYQFGIGPNGDLPGDVKMNYGGAVFRDQSTGIRLYGAYASMLTIIDPATDPLGRRVLPPFDGLLPGSPPSGPLLEIGGKRYDVFLTFGAIAPGSVLEVGNRLSVSGVVWPPIRGVVRGKITSPSGKESTFDTPSNAVGLFNTPGPSASEPGEWVIDAEGFCDGRTSVGVIAELVPEEHWPHGGGIGLEDTRFVVPVVPEDAEPIVFDLVAGSTPSPPEPLVISGRLPQGVPTDRVHVLVSLPGQVIDSTTLPTRNGSFAYRYDPSHLSKRFPNIDVSLPSPDPMLCQPAWCDTVTFTFWAGSGEGIRAGMVLLQGEDLFALSSTGKPPPKPASKPTIAKPSLPPSRLGMSKDALPPPISRASARNAPHTSLMALSSSGATLFAAHRWSGEVVRLDVGGRAAQVEATANTGGEVRSLTLSGDEALLYATLSDEAEVVVLGAKHCAEIWRLPVSGEPWAALPSPDTKSLFVADFDGNRIQRIDASTGEVERTSPTVVRPSCLTWDLEGRTIYTVGFRSGEITQLDLQCRVLHRFPAPGQLNQCQSLTFGPDGALYAPQTRSDTVVGGRTFDRSVFPVVALLAPGAAEVSLRYFPDLLVVPPHRPVDLAVDSETVYLACAGSDDVLALERKSGFARWHTQEVGLEPQGIALDPFRHRLYVLTMTGQEIVSLSSTTGHILSRVRYAHDPTPRTIARGRYLFGTATDKRLTKDQWMSCAACHPNADQDGRQWDFGDGRLDTRSLRGCLLTAPLHFDAHADEIQDTFRFTRRVMAGRWFVPLERMHRELREPNAGLDPDLDALAEYVASLKPHHSPPPPATAQSLIDKGRRLFHDEKTGCFRCHPPPYYTDSGTRTEDGELLLHNVGTLQSERQHGLVRLDTPTLLGLRQSEPYLHDGRAKTLEEVVTKFNPQDQHGHTSHLIALEIRALVEFLQDLPASDEDPVVSGNSVSAENSGKEEVGAGPIGQSKDGSSSGQ